MGCPHCLQDSQPNSQHMADEVFRKALAFGEWSGNIRYNISGGEPTEHPNFAGLMEILFEQLDAQAKPDHIFTMMTGHTVPVFTLLSNGDWFADEKQTKYIVEKVLCNNHLECLQICSIDGLYKNYDFINDNTAKLEWLSPKVYVYTAGIKAMDDLGRARKAPDFVRRQVENNKHFMSCLNCSLVSKQVNDIRILMNTLFLHDQSCKPLIDWKGDVHLSESHLCPSVGNVMKDSFDEIWQRMRNFKPCGRCLQYKRFMESDEPKIIQAKKIILSDE